MNYYSADRRSVLCCSFCISYDIYLFGDLKSPVPRTKTDRFLFFFIQYFIQKPVGMRKREEMNEIKANRPRLPVWSVPGTDSGWH